MAGGYTQETSALSDQSGWTGNAEWLSNSAITDLSFTNIYGTLIAGTTLSLYGISNS